MSEPTIVFTLLEDGRTVKLIRPFFTTITVNRVPVSICVPDGFTSDLATVPRFFWRLFPPFGRWSIPAIIHDYLYSQHARRLPVIRDLSRCQCDRAFLAAMGAYRVNPLARYTIYLAVRLFGWSKFRV